MATGHDKHKDRDRDTDTGLTGTGLTGAGTSGPGPETTTSTRQPSQLAVLLATVGTPPLDAEQARVAAMNLFDNFVLAQDRAELFFGSKNALFSPGDVPDPRHDALARLVRALAGALRMRLEAHENLTGTRELLRGIPTLGAVHIEGALGGFDLRRGAPFVFSAELMLGGRLTAGVDPLESTDAGVIRRLLALTTRGLMVPKNNRSGGVVADLGAVTLAMGLLDLMANPRSALRAARARLAKSGRLAADGTARVRDVGQALRELMTHAVSSATQAGAAGRDLVKETVLSNDLFELTAVSLARAVYDGLAPDDEHPLVVPGVEETDELTVAPVALPGNDESNANASGPVLGLYHRIAFVPLPYARAANALDEAAQSVTAATVATMPGMGPRLGARTPSRPGMSMIPPAGAASGALAGGLDEATFSRAREAARAPGGVQKAAAVVASVGASYDANLDAADPRHTWRRGPHANAAATLVRATEGDPATQFACVVGARSHAGAEFLASLGAALAQSGRWYALAPRVKDQVIGFEPLASPSAAGAAPGAGASFAQSAGAALRRADLSRWLDEGSLRSVDWAVEAGACIVVNAALLDAEPGGAPYAALLRLARDVADRVEPRAVLVLAGAPTYLHASKALDVLARHPEAELGPAPLRPGTAWVIRVDAPLSARGVTIEKRGADEALLATLAEPFALSSAFCELASRAALLPPEAKYRGRALRLAALAASGAPGYAGLIDARKAAERAASEPWSGAAIRRALLAGVASHTTARAAASAGLGYELAACARHEVAVAVAEWEGSAPRPHVSRLADVARGQLVELLLLAHPRVTLLAGDALMGAAGSITREWLEPVGPIDAVVSPALGVRASGTVYGPKIDARTETRTPVPLGFVFRGGGADLTALVDVSVGPLGPRAAPAPCMELHWRPAEGRDVSLGSVALVLGALHEVTRRWNSDAVGRASPRDGRPGFAVAVDVQLDARLLPETLRLSIPVRDRTSAAELQRAVGELGSRLMAAIGGDGPAEWTAMLFDARGASAPLPVGEALIAQECATRWARALRVLPRYFPVGVSANSRYAVEAEIATASALGLPGAVLIERRIPAATPEARALLAWLATAAPDVAPRAREVLSLMPVHPSALQGSELDLIDRAVSVAWFLHANFCQSAPGPLRWSPQDLPAGAQVLPKLLDPAALRQWLGRKVGRNAHVEQRATAALQALEPSVVVEG